MSETAPVIAVAHPVERPQSRAEAVAWAWLAGYSGNTRAAYERDLKDWGEWCETEGLDPLEARRWHIDTYARSMEERELKPSTIARRLAALRGFYGYAAREGAIAESPATEANVPTVDSESPQLGLSREELLELFDAAEESGKRDYALALILGLNGLRISEACSLDVSDYTSLRGHKILEIRRKGGRTATTALAPRTVAALDDYLDGRSEGPIFKKRNGQRLDRHAAYRRVARLARAAGIEIAVTPHTLRHTFVTLSLDAGVSPRDVQDAAGHRDPRTTQRYDRGRGNLERHPTYQLAAYLST